MALHSLGQKAFGRGSKRRGNHRLSRMKSTLRIISNIGLIIGQCILLFVSRDLGLTVIICSSVLSFPFFLQERMWDVIVLMAFMLGINITGLLVK